MKLATNHFESKTQRNCELKYTINDCDYIPAKTGLKI